MGGATDEKCNALNWADIEAGKRWGRHDLLYLNVFVEVAQDFLKVTVLKALAPTQKEPPFVVAQLVVLLIFAGPTILAAKRAHIEPARTA